MSKASEWLDSLEQFECPSCGQQTIFRTGCNDCMIKEDNEQEIKYLTKVVAELEQEIFSKRFELSSKKSRLFELNIKRGKV